jgi:hypothetical protein
MLTVHLLKHLPHPFDVIVVQKPCFRIFLVFFERNAEGIRNIDGLAIILAKKYADNTLA